MARCWASCAARASRWRLAGGFGGAEAAFCPEGEEEGEGEADCESQGDYYRVAGDEAAAGLEQGGHRVDRGDGVDPAAEEVEGDVDGSEEEDEEGGELHQRAALDRAHPQGHPGRPEGGRDVDQDREEV